MPSTWGDPKKWEDDSELVSGLSDGAMYEWSELNVYRRLSDGKLFWGSGSGCSCNCFEDSFDSWEDFEDLEETWDDFEATVNRMECSPTERIEFIMEIKAERDKCLITS